jgi:hypothetical protein
MDRVDAARACERNGISELRHRRKIRTKKESSTEKKKKKKEGPNEMECSHHHPIQKDKDGNQHENGSGNEQRNDKRPTEKHLRNCTLHFLSSLPSNFVTVFCGVSSANGPGRWSRNCQCSVALRGIHVHGSRHCFPGHICYSNFQAVWGYFGGGMLCLFRLSL